MCHRPRRHWGYGASMRSTTRPPHEIQMGWGSGSRAHCSVLVGGGGAGADTKGLGLWDLGCSERSVSDLPWGSAQVVGAEVSNVRLVFPVGE
jgi:hypothetical protein